MASNGKSYGPANPHPLSQMRTELVWEGKYDEYGSRREVDVAGLSMPMQKIETIDQPRSEAAAAGQLDIFEKETKRLDDFRNMLIWGDNKLVMASLLTNFKGCIDLIYIDPPFDAGADFTMNVPIGDETDTVEKEQSTLEMVAYRDMWGRGADSYLQIMFDRLVLIRDLLSERGSFVLHCDWRINFHLREICEEVFGKGRFRNEIIWHYENKLGTGWSAKTFDTRHDVLLLYTKSDTYVHNPITEPVRNKKQQPVTKKIEGKRVWLRNDDGSLMYAEGADERPVGDLWNIPIINPVADERLDYPTQKPLRLLERIIAATTTSDSLVADFFCGSGTTLDAAEHLGRRWIGCDLGRFAVHTARKRLIDVQRKLSFEESPYRAFDVHNLGRYERQWWQKASLKGADEEHRRVVLEFFQAEILSAAPSRLIHGRKNGAFCHVDNIDSIFSRGEARNVAKAVAAASGRECYCLAWEFEMDLRLTLAALEQELGVKLKLIQIPREIMERNRKSPPPFLEMAVLEAEPVLRGKGDDRTVDIKLTKFLPSLAEVPTKELEALRERAVNSGFDFIDFWAIDFDWHPDRPFNHYWQDYRTRKDRSLKTVSEAGHKYPKAGKYTACVKAVDVFGCDTSITVEVKV